MATQIRSVLKFLLPVMLVLSLSRCANDPGQEGNVTILTRSVILISGEIPSPYRSTLLRTLNEEIKHRSGLAWSSSDRWNDKGVTIALMLAGEHQLKARQGPLNDKSRSALNKNESYYLKLDRTGAHPVIWIIGRDVRGLFYGIGRLLRILDFSENRIALDQVLNESSAPVYSIRGHQLGYRNTANSWDAWNVKQYEQYIRDLVLFGTNCIEDIPFQSKKREVLMKMPHEKMHRKISGICNNYDIDYWVWTPAGGDLSDPGVQNKDLEKHEAFYKSIPRLDAVFFPGGDPGDNHPKYVMPFLEKLSALLHKYHPGAGMWISLQGFDKEKTDYFFNYLYENDPDWLEGVVYGPGSPPVDIERKRLPGKYKHRLYGDITHTIRCQYPTPDFDQAFALTLGREPTNPEPYYYARIFRQDMPFTDGFLTYSDGVHDDVNKIVWTRLGWDPELEPLQIVREYSRFFFGKRVADKAADGILALERNWDGPLLPNGAVEGTLELWQNLEAGHPELNGNWRFKQLAMRAWYDAYTRRRLIYETALEDSAYLILKKADEIGADNAMDLAIEMVNRADTKPVARELNSRITRYCDELFDLIGLQTSVTKYHARGYERGCVLDFVNYPLNNRWWLEDEFKKIRAMASEEKKLDRLELIRTWSNPGPGNYYDNISHVSEGPHVVSRTDDAIDYAWWENGFSRKRLSTQLFQFSPVLEYEKLDPETDYFIRVSGYGEALLRANGIRLDPVQYEKELETFKVFILPKELIPDGKLKLTFDRPDESHLNWRQYSKVTDVWLFRQLPESAK